MSSTAERPHVIIAIDGPAASGKSSVSHLLAHKLNYAYVNSGAMYRAVTWLVLDRKVDPDDSATVLALVKKTNIECGTIKDESFIRMDGIDPEPFLRDPQINSNVSKIASIPEVREILVARQREYGQDYDLVMEGRDIGSVVFPNTKYKFYIDASVEVRAQRRASQGQLDEIAQRDRTDSSRKASPLTIAEDAHVIDSSHLTIEGVVGEIIGRLKKKGLPVEL